MSDMVASKSKAINAPLPGRPVRGSSTGRPTMALLDLLGRRWALRILWELRDGRGQTFRVLQQSCADMSSSVLSDRLHELREARIVTAGPGGYVLTPAGRGLLDALEPLNEWALSWGARCTPATGARSPKP